MQNRGYNVENMVIFNAILINEYCMGGIFGTTFMLSYYLDSNKFMLA